jgi:hypothetical protein
MTSGGQLMNTLLIDAYLKARASFIPFDGVIGVGYGPKFRAGKVAKDEAIVILVERKLLSNEIKSDQAIPPIFEGFPTDVREPKLTVESEKQFDPNKPPKSGEDCLTDYEWIDWEKIHAINQRQKEKKQTSGGL